jgi:hypothetical protein
MAPLHTYITSLNTSGMNVDTGMYSGNKTEFFWMSFGNRTVTPSTSLYTYPSSFYSFPSSSSSPTSTSSKSAGWTTLVNGFTFQWGYGPNENITNAQPITFSVPFSQVFGAQVSMSYCNKNTNGFTQTTSWWDGSVTGGVVNNSTMAPLRTYITSLSNSGMNVDTGYGSNNKSEFFWLSYGLYSPSTTTTGPPVVSDGSALFPSSTTSATTPSTTSGYIIVDSTSRFAIQWGCGKIDSSGATITFSKAFTQVVGAQITKSNCNNNSQWGSGIVNSTSMSPLNTYIMALSNTGINVDPGYGSTNKSEYFWIAYGIM